MEKPPIHEGLLLDETVTYTLTELTQFGGLQEKIIIEMVEYGIVEPEGENQEKWIFRSKSIIRFQKAIRLHQDLNINWPGISLALDLLDEVHELRQLVKTLQKD